MNIWHVLGIEKTKDKVAIKDAYRAKLVNVNPEDNAEGFMALRKAFEEAMNLADKKDEHSEESEYEPGSVMYELTSLYNDFNRRIDVDEWRKIFARDEFVSLDTAEEYLGVFLRFLMENYFVPQSVYILICDTFNIMEMKSELSEIYSENFINHIIDNARYRDPINYYLFEGELDEVEKYIDLYYGLDSAIRRRNVEEQKRLISELEELSLYHPYLEVAKNRHEIHKMNENVASSDERRDKYADELLVLQNKAELLLSNYEDDYYILLLCGDLAIIRMDAESADKYYGRLAQLEPDDISIKNRLGDLYIVQGKFEEARDLFMKLLDINQYDDGARYGLTRANTELIEKYTKILEGKPDDEKTKYELVWAHYRNGEFSVCVDILQKFTPSDNNKCDYYDLLGRNLMYLGRYDEALNALFAWRDAILDIPESDESEKAVKNKKRYHYVNYYIGECYIYKKQYEEARKYLGISISHKHEYVEYAYDALCKLEYECGNFDECLKLCEKLLETSITYDAYLYMAKCFYQLDEYGHSISNCESAIKIQPFFYEPYLLMIKMYWECEEYEYADRVINRFEQCTGGFKNDEIEYYRGRSAMRKGENEAAINIFKDILERKDTQEASMEESNYLNVYTLLAACYERLDMEDKALLLLEKGLEADKDDVFFLNRLGSVCHVMGDFKRSITCFDKILELSKEGTYRERAYRSKAAAYCCLKEFEKAKAVYEEYFKEYGYNSWAVIDYGELLIRMNLVKQCFEFMKKAYDSTEDENLKRPILGNLCCMAGNEGYLDEAYSAYKKIVENNPNEFHIYRIMGFVYLDHKHFEEAVKLFKKSIALDEKKETYTAGLLLLAVRQFDDIYKPEYSQYVELANEQLEYEDDAYVLLKKSEILRAIGKHEDALKCCDLAMEYKRSKDTCYVENYDAWYEKGLVYYELKDYKNALECFEKAQSIYGHHKQYLDFIDECKEMLEE